MVVRRRFRIGLGIAVSVLAPGARPRRGCGGWRSGQLFPGPPGGLPHPCLRLAVLMFRAQGRGCHKWRRILKSGGRIGRGAGIRARRAPANAGMRALLPPFSVASSGRGMNPEPALEGAKGLSMPMPGRGKASTPFLDAMPPRYAHARTGKGQQDPVKQERRMRARLRRTLKLGNGRRAFGTGPPAGSQTGYPAGRRTGRAPRRFFFRPQTAQMPRLPGWPLPIV